MSFARVQPSVLQVKRLRLGHIRSR
jgi:hypothetical protein